MHFWESKKLTLELFQLQITSEKCNSYLLIGISDSFPNINEIFEIDADHLLKIICKISLKENAGICNSSADFQQTIFRASAEVLKYL